MAQGFLQARCQLHQQTKHINSKLRTHGKHQTSCFRDLHLTLNVRKQQFSFHATSCCFIKNWVTVTALTFVLILQCHVPLFFIIAIMESSYFSFIFVQLTCIPSFTIPELLIRKLGQRRVWPTKLAALCRMMLSGVPWMTPCLLQLYYGNHWQHVHFTS